MGTSQHRDGRPAVRVASDSHALRVIAEDRVDIAVDGQADVERSDDVVTVSALRGRMTVRVPFDTDVVVGATSGQVDIVGPVGRVAVSAGSGRVRVADAASADVRSDSGAIEIRRCDDQCRVRGDSGKVDVKGCGPADVTTRSGRISLSGVRGDVRAHCVSGQVRVRLDEAADVDAETVSGRIDLSYPAGVTAARDGDPAPDADCVVRARTVSGRVTVGNR